MTDRMSLTLAQADPEVAAALDHETLRQHEGLEMIASENFVSEAVLEAAGSIFTNKYAEGYPGRRYYGGCEYADVVENLARDRAKQIFGGDHVNVQPHSGSQANASAYAAVLQTGDTILGLDLAHGGHLTHGHRLSFSGKLYRPTFYQVRKDTELIDYDELEAIALREKPKAIIGGGSAYPRLWDFARMRQIADKVGAFYIFDMAHIAGLSPVAFILRPYLTRTSPPPPPTKPSAVPAPDSSSAARISPPPLTRPSSPASRADRSCTSLPPRPSPLLRPCAPTSKSTLRKPSPTPRSSLPSLAAAGFRIVSGGTDNHLMLVDVFQKGILGSEAELALGKAGITVNKNSIPYDTNPPLKPSGIRVGTPALTTRGMKEQEMRTIGAWIAKALEVRNDAAALERIRLEVAELANQFPLYAWRRAPVAVAG
jgi:glycine hydroxymethyltransferase